MTEASPVVSLNLPHPACGRGADTIQLGWREGSVGRLVPGGAMQLLDAETNQSGATRGILAFRGANIITGYLNNQSPEKFRQGWLITGDVARVDAEGFLFLEGRSSRFSKIAGEMVSHAAIEQAIASALPPGAEDCVLGRACRGKGEELVHLTTRDITRADVIAGLAGRIPNLWIPRRVIRIAHLPVLSTGKLDLAACQRLVDGAGVVA